MKDKTINLKHKALDLLSRREHSYKELYAKLAKFSQDHAEITAVLDEMVSKKYLNEERYIEAYISSKHKKYGSLKIKYLLNSKVADPDLVDELYKDANINELAIATELLHKKYTTLPTDINGRAKVVRFLLNRGFNYSIATQAIKIFNSQNEEISYDYEE